MSWGARVQVGFVGFSAHMEGKECDDMEVGIQKYGSSCSEAY